MNDGEDDAQIFPEFKQDAQQGNGIRSAGDGHPEAVASPQQIVFADILQDRLAELVHGNILYARHCEGGRREPTIALERGAVVRKKNHDKAGDKEQEHLREGKSHEMQHQAVERNGFAEGVGNQVPGAPASECVRIFRLGR